MWCGGFPSERVSNIMHISASQCLTQDTWSVHISQRALSSPQKLRSRIGAFTHQHAQMQAHRIKRQMRELLALKLRLPLAVPPTLQQPHSNLHVPAHALTPSPPRVPSLKLTRFRSSQSCAACQPQLPAPLQLSQQNHAQRSSQTAAQPTVRRCQWCARQRRGCPGTGRT